MPELRSDLIKAANEGLKGNFGPIAELIENKKITDTDYRALIQHAALYLTRLKIDLAFPGKDTRIESGDSVSRLEKGEKYLAFLKTFTESAEKDFDEPNLDPHADRHSSLLKKKGKRT